MRDSYGERLTRPSASRISLASRVWPFSTCGLAICYLLRFAYHFSESFKRQAITYTEFCFANYQ